MTIRVLMVEDNAADAAFIRLMAKESQDPEISLEHVARLSSAIATLQRDKPDVVLLDLRLPDAVGMACLEGVLKAAPGVPVVILTGEDDEEMATQMIQRGAKGYLMKRKCDSERLLQALRDATKPGFGSVK